MGIRRLPGHHYSQSTADYHHSLDGMGDYVIACDWVQHCESLAIYCLTRGRAGLRRYMPVLKMMLSHFTDDCNFHVTNGSVCIEADPFVT
jgi:hypothetical protein